jgi:Zn-dependent protease
MALIIKISVVFPHLIPPSATTAMELLSIMIKVNIVLAVINLMPIPPLDGSKILTFFLPRELALKLICLNPQICFIVLIVLLTTGILGRLITPIITAFQVFIFGIIKFIAV